MQFYKNELWGSWVKCSTEINQTVYVKLNKRKEVWRVAKSATLPL